MKLLVRLPSAPQSTLFVSGFMDYTHGRYTKIDCFVLWAVYFLFEDFLAISTYSGGATSK